MSTIGNKTAGGFSTITKQSITGNGGTSYTLEQSVNNENELEVYVNNTRQEPTTAYTAQGTTLTMTGAVNASDSFYVIFQGKAVVSQEGIFGNSSTRFTSDNVTIGGTLGVTGATTLSSTLNATGATTLSSTLNVTGATTTTGDITTSNSSGHRSLTVKGNTTTNYTGGSLLLANEGMDTNYGGTYLYHHKAGGSGTDDAAFNISQRTAAGGYVSNIWNVDYKNNAHSFYVPNGGVSGSTVLGINGSGHINMSQQPAVTFQGTSNGNTTTNTGEKFGSTSQGNPAFTTSNGVIAHISSSGITYNSSTGVFTVSTAGKYLLYFQAYNNGGVVTSTRVSIYHNNTQVMLAHSPDLSYGTIHVNHLANAAANDYFDFRHESGGNRDFFMGSQHLGGYIVKVA